MTPYERQKKATAAYIQIMLDPSLGPVPKFLESPEGWQDKRWSKELRLLFRWHIIDIRSTESFGELRRWCENEPSITGHFWGNQKGNLWYFSNEESALYFRMMKG